MLDRPISHVIFDCDGVLVDSEPLATRVLRDGLEQQGLVLTLDQVVDRFLGRSTATMERILREDHDLVLDDSAQEAMRQNLYALFRAELRPIAGIEGLIRHLRLPYCLASSSHLRRIEVALEVTGLADLFHGRIYNAAMVSRGKPAPDLFLHAAAAMGADPATTLVIEDSPAGIEAAQRAGMPVIGFTGGGHARSPRHRAGLAALRPDAMTDDMADIARILGAVPA